MSAAESARPRAHRCASPFRRFRLRIDRACDDRTPSSECECADRSSFRLLLVENRRNQIPRHRLEMGRLHRVTGTPLRERSDRSCVAEELSERNLGMNNGEVATRFDAVNATAAPAQVAANVTLKFVRSDVLHFHNRLEQNRLPLTEAILHRK